MPVASPPRAQPTGPCRRPRSVRPLLVLTATLSSGFWAVAAEALPESLSTSTWTLTASPDGAPPPAAPPPSTESPPREQTGSSVPPFQLGALAGVGFPRPVSFEVITRLGGYVGLGAEYGLLPTVSISGISTSTWAASGDVRVFPFRGAFFLGLRGGRQHIDAGTTVNVAGVGSASGSADLDTWFVNPRIGFLWTIKYGFTLAMEAGVQIPIGSSFESSLPSAVAIQVRDSGPVRTLSGVLPTVDLLRVGMMF